MRQFDRIYNTFPGNEILIRFGKKAKKGFHFKQFMEEVDFANLRKAYFCCNLSGSTDFVSLLAQ